MNVTYLSAEGTVDEFVAHALQTKAALIDAVVEGRGDVPADGDLLSELEGLLRTLSPGIATLPDDASGEDPVDRLLREVVASARADRTERSADATGVARPRLSADAVLALARVLAGPAVRRYRASSGSKPGAYYLLDVDEGDVSCTCRGFEYRGTCAHALALKRALVAGGPLPEGFTAFAG